jgi:hypothetical protein
MLPWRAPVGGGREPAGDDPAGLGARVVVLARAMNPD